MEEKKYHIDESKVAGDKVCEPSPAYRSATSASSVSWMRLMIPIPILWGARWSR